MYRRGSASRVGRAPPPHENSATTLANGRERKRVQVACLRCRKRKIKCTGMSADGCSNCRGHGIPASHCVVKRAGPTTLLELKPEAVRPPIPSTDSQHLLPINGYGGGHVSSLQSWQYSSRLPTNGQPADTRDHLGSDYEEMHREPGISSYAAIQPEVNSHFEFIARQLPAPGPGTRLPSMATQDGVIASSQGALYKTWPSWTPGPGDGYIPPPSRLSYSAQQYEDGSRMLSAGYGAAASPTYLLPSFVPAPSSAAQMDVYDQVSRPYMPSQPVPYGYGPYQVVENEPSRYTSMTIS